MFTVSNNFLLDCYLVLNELRKRTGYCFTTKDIQEETRISGSPLLKQLPLFMTQCTEIH